MLCSAEERKVLFACFRRHVNERALSYEQIDTRDLRILLAKGVGVAGDKAASANGRRILVDAIPSEGLPNAMVAKAGSSCYVGLLSSFIFYALALSAITANRGRAVFGDDPLDPGDEAFRNHPWGFGWMSGVNYAGEDQTARYSPLAAMISLFCHEFILAHEIGHAVSGHCDFYGATGGAVQIDELGADIADPSKDEVRKYMEIEADMFAYEYFVKDYERQNPGYVERMNGMTELPIEHAYRTVQVFSYILALWLLMISRFEATTKEYRTFLAEEYLRTGSYPSYGVRVAMSVNRLRLLAVTKQDRTMAAILDKVAAAYARLAAYNVFFIPINQTLQHADVVAADAAAYDHERYSAVRAKLKPFRWAGINYL